MIDNNHSPEGLEYWARDLERELTAAQAEALKLQEENAKLQERIRRLGEVGDYMAYNENVEFNSLVAFWEKAKDTQ